MKEQLSIQLINNILLKPLKYRSTYKAYEF